MNHKHIILLEYKELGREIMHPNQSVLNHIYFIVQQNNKSIEQLWDKQIRWRLIGEIKSYLEMQSKLRILNFLYLKVLPFQIRKGWIEKEVKKYLIEYVIEFNRIENKLGKIIEQIIKKEEERIINSILTIYK